MKLNKLYSTIESSYLKGKYNKISFKKKRGFDKFFSSGKKEVEIKDIQNEIEKYILYLWSIENNKTKNISVLKHIYEIENIGDISFLKKVTFNSLLKFISPQTEVI